MIKRTTVLLIMVIMVVIVRFFMTKTMIIAIMEELVTIIIVTVIIMTHRRNSMEKKKRDFIKKLVKWTHRKKFCYQRHKHYAEMVKNTTEKKLKTMGHITPFIDHYPRNRWWEILIPFSDTSC